MESQSKSKNVIHVTTNSWDADILKSDLPVFVDFWAEWCGPCRMVGPAVEQLSQTMSDKIKVAKLNVDENQEIAMRYGVRSIPSLILFKAGKEIARTVGAAPKEAYQKFVEQHLSKVLLTLNTIKLGLNTLPIKSPGVERIRMTTVIAEATEQQNKK